MGKSPSCDKNGLKKGPWSAEEDRKLITYIQKHGHGRWRILPKNAGLRRCGKSCRLRWTNYLRPDIKRGKFSEEEEDVIIQLHSVLGNKWSTIAARLPGRTDNEIKNYWNTHIKKRLLRMGIDPVTHKPRLDLLQLYYSLLYNSSLGYNHGSSDHELNISSLLGIGHMLSPDLLNLANSFFSCQDHVGPKDLQDSQRGQFQWSSQPNDLLNQIQACSNTSIAAQLLNGSQANLKQLSCNPTSFSCQDSLQISRQTSANTNIGGSSCSVDMSNYMHLDSDNNKSFNSNSFERLPSLGFSLLLSTPSSSATYLNGCGCTQDERESTFSCNMSMFDNDIPNNSLYANRLI